jgi:hypothetical protein
MDRLIKRRRLTALLVALLAGCALAVGVALGEHPAKENPGVIPVALGGPPAATTTVTVRPQAQTPASVQAAARQAGAGAARVTVGAPLAAPPVPSGFVGLSIEYSAVPVYGRAATVFGQLIRNLTPGQTPILRIGGDSTDHAWFPIPHYSNPGLWNWLNPIWMSLARAIVADSGARLALGLNMEVNNLKVTLAEANGLLKGLGRSAIAAFEVGNEPNLYAAFPWYAFNNKAVYARSPSSWSLGAWIQQLHATVPKLPKLPLWGPATGGTPWMNSLPQLAAAMPGLATVSYHGYPTSCYVSHNSPQSDTLGNLLAPSSSTGLVAQMSPYIAFAHRHRLGFRIDEINTVACAGKLGTPNIGAAIWALEAGFAFLRGGVSGVNLHMFPKAAYRLFTIANEGGSWLASAEPEYYGWMMLGQAAPAGARLLSAATSGDPHVKAYATAANGTTRVVLVNDDPSGAATVSLSAPGSSVAQLESLRAPSLTATSGITYGGMTITNSATGQLAGTPQVQALTGHGLFSVRLPAASATLVTLGS